VAQCNDRRQVARVRRDLPILIVSGERDPSGHNGAGPLAVSEQYSSVGVADVTCTLYPDARHEIFNETNRDEVTADLIQWLDAHIPA
jgi:alpha-beta hydrolase superfamily lysophospholipase